MKINSLCIAIIAAFVGTAVGSAVVSSAPGAAFSSEAAVKKNDETIQTLTSGSNQILVESEFPPADLRPTDGAGATPSSTALGAYVPPNSVFEKLAKTAAKSSTEVAENSPADTSVGTFVDTDVPPPSTKDTEQNGLTIVTAEGCYDCDEATAWTFGGTDTTTTKSVQTSAAVSSSSDGIGNVNDLADKSEEEEEEDAPVVPVVVTVDSASNTPDDAGSSAGPADLATSIITADQTVMDATDVMANLAGLHVPSTPTSVPTSEAETKAEEYEAINGTPADVDESLDPSLNGSNATNATSATNGHDMTIVADAHTMVDTNEAMADLAGLLLDDEDVNDGSAAASALKATGAISSTTTITTATVEKEEEKKKDEKKDEKKKKKKPIFLPSPKFREGTPLIHRFLLSIPAYLPDPAVLFERACEEAYDFIATNSARDVLSKSAASISNGINKTSAALTDAANVALGKAATLGNELNATVLETIIDSIDEADVKKVNHGIEVGFACLLFVLSCLAIDYYLFLA